MFPFHKSISIIINGRHKIVKSKKTSYNDIVLLSAEDDIKHALIDCLLHAGNVFTVTYDNGPKKNQREGSITKGDSLKLTQGMIINVSTTSNA